MSRKDASKVQGSLRGSMSKIRFFLGSHACLLLFLVLNGLTSKASAAGATSNASSSFQLTVQSTGEGAGTVTSSPAGISCPTTCSADFPSGTVVTLTETPDSTSTFGGWYDACGGTAGCSVNLKANATVMAQFNLTNPPALVVVQKTG